MTESEWLACEDPATMLEFWWEKASERKLRLVGCAACRRIWRNILDPRCRLAVEASELFADNLISARKLDLLSAEAEESFEDALIEDDEGSSSAASVAHAVSYSSSPDLSLQVLLEAIGSAAEVPTGRIEAERAVQASLIRDIFDNPFHLVAFDPSWRTETVALFAQQMYEHGDFTAMPILADALQDAGCKCQEVLMHCRDPKGIHVRGCWVVDLVLGKS